MSDYITIAIDGGNGFVNGAQQMKRSPKTVSFPSTRARVTGITIGSEHESKFDYYDWRGKRLVAGDDIRHSDNAPVPHWGEDDRYGNEQHLFYMAVACARLGVKRGKVNLTTFMPVNNYRKQKEITIERIREDSPVEIHVSGEKKPRTWEYADVRIVPEGIAALTCFLIDENGNVQDSDIGQGRTMLIDIGAFTVDVVETEGGDIRPESIADSTHEQAGLFMNLHERIRKDQQLRFPGLRLEKIDKAIRDGLRTGVFMLEQGIRTADFTEDYHRYIQDYIDDLADLFGRRLRDVHRVILVGGGACMVHERLNEFFHGRIVNNDDYPSVKGIHPTMMNAIGGLRLARVQGVQA